MGTGLPIFQSAKMRDMSQESELPVVAWEDPFGGLDTQDPAVFLEGATKREQTYLKACRPLTYKSDAERAIATREARIAELEADAARWRKGAARFMFPEFCSHTSGTKSGHSWYMPTYPAETPIEYETAEEAIDAALSSPPSTGEL